MRFFIVDNEPVEVARLRDMLGNLYPEASVWPAASRTYKSWDKVTSALEQNTTTADELVVLLDLGVESQNREAVRTGVSRAYGLRALRPNAVFIAYTEYFEIAEGQPHFDETFDGVLDKQRLTGFDRREEQIAYIRQIVTLAVRRRTGATPNYLLKDSVGLRLARAAFGEEVFDYLVQEIAPGWQDVEIRALTSGHSGASILAISGMLAHGRQRIVIKCAHDRELIKKEVARVREHISELGPLGWGVLGTFEEAYHTLPGNSGHYFRQAEIQGDPLLDILMKVGWNQETKQSISGIVSLEIRCYEQRKEDAFGTLRPEERFLPSAVDLGRAHQSLKFLERLGNTLQQQEQWPSQLPAPVKLALELCNLFNNWRTMMSTEKPLFSVAQHGDLNPGNILVPTAERVVLIDLARLGRWPVGYDLSRLATILRVRLIDHENHRDWIVNRISMWLKDSFCQLEDEIEPSESACPPAMYCDQAFRRFVLTRADEERPVLMRGYMLGTIWDLFKILSYGDLSPYKRVWVLIEAWQLAVRLKLIQTGDHTCK